MSPEFLIGLLTNRLTFLGEQRMLADSRGDVDAVIRIDADIAATGESLVLLQNV